jgi:hypothetical protein
MALAACRGRDHDGVESGSTGGTISPETSVRELTGPDIGLTPRLPPVERFLGDFLADSTTGKTWGRPVGLAAGQDGALLVADDAGNRVWRVACAAE